MKVEGHLLRIVEPTASAGITSGGFSRTSFISPGSITDELDNHTFGNVVQVIWEIQQLCYEE